MQTTALTEWHRSYGAAMGDFGGYSMPMWYSGARNEHLAVLTHAGIFDTCHQPIVMVSGPDAFPFLQHCLTKDIGCIGKACGKLPRGQCTNGAILDERGWVVDDCIVYRLDGDEYMVAVNSGMGEKVMAHLTPHIPGHDVSVDNYEGRIGKIDIQGIFAPKILAECIEGGKSALADFSYFRFRGHFFESSPHSDELRLANGAPLLLSRTGYTGEIGFEIYLARENLEKAWTMFIDAGEKYGMIPCGLASRDSLRAGAVLPLSGQDIGAWPFINNPWTYALPFNKDKTGFTKDFIGREALENCDSCDYTLPFVGSDPRKVSVHGDQARVLDTGGNDIGIVLTCATDPGIGMIDGRIVSVASPTAPDGFSPHGLSCGFVKVNRLLDNGENIVLKDSRRAIPVKITQSVRPDRTARLDINDLL